MIYNFTYTPVIEQCKMLSSYEGRDYVNEKGESMYLTVKITEQDLPLLNTFITQAVSTLEERIARILIGTERTQDGFTWEIRSEATRWNKNTHLTQNLQEAIVGYVMMNWLAERKPSSVETYRNIWTGMSEMCIRNIFRKMPPARIRKPMGDIEETTVTYLPEKTEEGEES